MKKAFFSCLFALVCVAQGMWAQTRVDTETELNSAIANGGNIVLYDDITLNDWVLIDAEVTVSIDLNGHKLNRGNPPEPTSSGHVLIIGGGANVTIKDSSTDGNGEITGGNADAGGGIWIGPRGTVTLQSGTITSCHASGKGGGIYNMGNLTINGGSINLSSAADGGGIYNEEGATLTLAGGIITGNIATNNGAGVSNYGTLNMRGDIVILNNHKEGALNDLYVPEGKVINVTGTFGSSSSIYLTLAGRQTLTSGYSTYNGYTDPNTFFHSDLISGTLSPAGTLSLVGGEVYYLLSENYITDVMLIGSSSSYVSELKTKFEGKGWTFIDKNLNAGRESHPHVHLLYKSEPAEAVNCDKRYITGFLLADNTLSEQDFTKQETIVYDGRTYYKVPAVDDQGFIDCGGNLNYSVSNNSNQGDKIFLYYTRDKFDDSRVVKSIVFDGSKSGALGDYLGKSVPLDLNKGGGGDYIYMHVGTTTGVTHKFSHAIWCEGNNTLNFAVLDHECQVGDTYNNQTVTNVWHGTQISNSDTSTGPEWRRNGTATKVVFEPSFAQSRPKSLYRWFYNFTNLSTIEGIENLNTSQCVSMDAVFSGCNNLKAIDLNGFDVSKVKTIKYMFEYCRSLETIYCNNSWSGYTNIENKDYTFSGCTNLKGAVAYNSEHTSGDMANPVTGYFTPSQMLADKSNNSNVLMFLFGKTQNITLDGRTLYKDGSWNTLCLPFSLSASQIASSPLAGATIMELDTENKWSMVNDQWSISESGTYQTGFASDGTLYLYFTEVNSITAGKPYIVKWETTGDPIENPTFNNVTITSTTPATIEAKNSGLNTVQFIGTYAPANLVANDKAKLYLGDDNKLYYPSSNMDINAFRGYFNVDLTGQPNGVRAFVLNFDNSEASSIENVQCPMFNVQSNNAWYDLQGRRMAHSQSSILNSQLKKGVYINNGKKQVIK